MCSFRLGWVNIIQGLSVGRVSFWISNVFGKEGYATVYEKLLLVNDVPLTPNSQYVFFVQQADCSTSSVNFVVNKTAD